MPTLRKQDHMSMYYSKSIHYGSCVIWGCTTIQDTESRNATRMPSLGRVSRRIPSTCSERWGLLTVSSAHRRWTSRRQNWTILQLRLRDLSSLNVFLSFVPIVHKDFGRLPNATIIHHASWRRSPRVVRHWSRPCRICCHSQKEACRPR